MLAGPRTRRLWRRPADEGALPRQRRLLVRLPRQAECRPPRPPGRCSYGLSQHIGFNAIEAPGCRSAMNKIRVARVSVCSEALSNPRAPCACATACGSAEPPRPFPAPVAPRVSRNCAEASFLGIPPRAASSSSRLSTPDRRCCRERGLARGRFSEVGRELRGPPLRPRPF
jgi:hypothetical protein